ncbi:hypothetical protein Tco_0421167 [Tanacetum coccineum]
MLTISGIFNSHSLARTPPDFDDLDDLVDEGMAFVQEKDAENQGVSTAGEGVSTDALRTPLTIITVFDDEDVTMTMDQTLIKMKEEKAKAKGVAIKDFDEIQARMDDDHELVVRVTHEEQEKYTNERRKKQIAVERAEVIRNKPPTRAQVRNRMITYLKHMGKYTHQQLKHKNFEEVQKLYEREKKWIDDFKPIDDDCFSQALDTVWVVFDCDSIFSLIMRSCVDIVFLLFCVSQQDLIPLVNPNE